MADLIRNENPPNSPEPKNSGRLTAGVILLLLAVIFAAVGFITGHYALLLVFLLLLISGFAVLPRRNADEQNYEAKMYGDRGERQAGFLLEKCLPDGYTVIQNTVVYYKDGRSEIDNIIVGKTGVFIVEVKNVKGNIYGNLNEKNWIQDKTDKYGIEHQKELYNPVKQVRTHVFRLANYLRDNRIFTHINGAVYFANPETAVHLNGDNTDIPVFTYRSAQGLIDFIMRGNANLSDKSIKRIIQLLSEAKE